ncbi:MBOAT family O-acyltransferase [Helicobacter anatolicus]|uniref:MBOAT family O-acyltransferase n=1 Tax=Helicobacter anatolicus TaxID=2905874 RepID=UPI001E41EE0A|nr:MBOAT family O-acyltransferase [Helicobacter anatolicus]MCE3037813.1 hypothetical protein [Helicobacter anatolicus]
MLFNSFAFVFLVIATLLVFYSKRFIKYQIYILITASFIFYAYSQPYLFLLLFFSASLNAFISYQVFWLEDIKKQKRYAIFGVMLNLFVLILFKYSPLFGEVMKVFVQRDFIENLLLLPLPIGISFYTFQGISIVVDLYKKQNLCQIPKNFFQHYLHTMFFIAFFPALIAGPIIKAHQFYPQITPKFLKNVDWYGCIKILILGYFLKMVIADNLKTQTFWMAYPYFEIYNSFSLAVFLFGYSMQIFADFAGYSLIAIGVAKLFGFDLPKNFNFPYIAKSFSEFWTRWHISLSTWLKEYLYIPLGGNKKGKLRTYFNLMVVMVLGGLWHGASMVYLFWGFYHGILLVVERIFRYIYIYIYIFKENFLINILRIFFVFCAVSFSWLFFVLKDMGEIVAYAKILFSLEGIFSNGMFAKTQIVMIFLYSLPVVVYHFNYLLSLKISKNLLDFPLFYAILLFLIFTNSGSAHAFVYFQF